MKATVGTNGRPTGHGDLRVVRRVSGQEHIEAWKRFVSDHPDATPFHSTAWLDTVADTFRYRPESVLLYDETGEAVAVVPRFRVLDVTGPSYVNPFCEYGYPLVAEGTDAGDVLAELRESVPIFGASILKDSVWSNIGEYNRSGYGAVVTGSSVRLPVDDAYDVVEEAAFDSEIRRNVRIARRRGLRSKPGTVAEFYPLYEQTMRRLGSPQFPRSFFENLIAHFGDRAQVLLAEGDDGPVAGLVCLLGNSMMSLWSNGSDESVWKAKPNHLLYANAIENACHGEQRVVDFGRSRRGSSVERFKIDFGGVAGQLVSYVTPAHRTNRASMDQYADAQRITQHATQLVTHPTAGPRLKELIHE